MQAISKALQPRHVRTTRQVASAIYTRARVHQEGDIVSAARGNGEDST